MSAQAYEPALDENSSTLVERLKRKRYRAKLVRRHDSPNGDGARRSVGIPAVEEKLLPLAVTRLLTAIDEQDCLRCRDGYRRHSGALDAVHTLTSKRPFGRYTWVVDADMQGCFDAIEHEWMIRMVAGRSDDRALLRLIKKWPKARYNQKVWK